MFSRFASTHSAIRVLIEGPDLVGKSTVASALVDHLRNGSRRVDHLNGKYSERSWSRVLRRFDANLLAQSNLLNTLYIASAILDRFTLASSPSAPVVICESYVDRAIAYGIAVRRNPFARLAARLPWLFPRFELVVLLTCPYEVRLKRLTSRPAPTEIDRITCDSSAMHDRFLAAYRCALGRHKNLLNFDTGTSSIEDIVGQIVCEIDRLTSPSQQRSRP